MPYAFCSTVSSKNLAYFQLHPKIKLHLRKIKRIRLFIWELLTIHRSSTHTCCLTWDCLNLTRMKVNSSKAKRNPSHERCFLFWLNGRFEEDTSASAQLNILQGCIQFENNGTSTHNRLTQRFTFAFAHYVLRAAMQCMKQNKQKFLPKQMHKHINKLFVYLNKDEDRSCFDTEIQLRTQMISAIWLYHKLCCETLKKKKIQNEADARALSCAFYIRHCKWKPKNLYLDHC